MVMKRMKNGLQLIEQGLGCWVVGGGGKMIAVILFSDIASLLKCFGHCFLVRHMPHSYFLDWLA